MNDRFQELSKEAGMRFGLSPAERKFAELIVRDCISKIESQRSSGENTDQWTITRDLCYHYMMADLKKHFGVE